MFGHAFTWSKKLNKIFKSHQKNKVQKIKMLLEFFYDLKDNLLSIHLSISIDKEKTEPTLVPTLCVQLIVF